MADPRIVTAVAYIIVAIAAISLSLVVWNTHPVNRVFSLGRYLTEEGLRWVLNNIKLLFALGLFAAASGTSRFVYWQAGVDGRANGWLHFFGLIEMVFAVWVAASVVKAAWRACRKG